MNSRAVKRFSLLFMLSLLAGCEQQIEAPVPPVIEAPVVEAPVVVKVAPSSVPAAAMKYRSVLIREAQFIFGLNAPIDFLAGQIQQESNWNAGVTAWDNGRGLAQFMDPTATWVAERYQDLGTPEPYNPLWAIRAMVRLDDYNTKHVLAADTPCDRWGAALKGYNAGLGYVLRAQRKSEQPGVWFGATEYIQSGQSAKNFEYSRLYPRWIVLKHAPKFRAWGSGIKCELEAT